MRKLGRGESVLQADRKGDALTVRKARVGGGKGSHQSSGGGESGLNNIETVHFGTTEWKMKGRKMEGNHSRS